jgi:hypothetical protein
MLAEKAARRRTSRLQGCIETRQIEARNPLIASNAVHLGLRAT